MRNSERESGRLDSKIDHNSHLTFSITAEEAGERLDSFLATRIEGWSRARLQRLIEDADVLINGATAKSAYKVRAADEIEIELTSSPSESFVPENIPIEVVYEDLDLIVINKPAGMVVHPAAGNSSGTLANALAFHFSELSTAGGAARPRSNWLKAWPENGSNQTVEFGNRVALIGGAQNTNEECYIWNKMGRLLGTNFVEHQARL